MLKVYKLALKISLKIFSSHKIKWFPKISPKSPQREAFIIVVKSKSEVSTNHSTADIQRRKLIQIFKGEGVIYVQILDNDDAFTMVFIADN